MEWLLGYAERRRADLVVGERIPFELENPCAVGHRPGGGRELDSKGILDDLFRVERQRAYEKGDFP